MGRKVYVRPPQKQGHKVSPKLNEGARARWGLYHKAMGMGLNVSRSTKIATMAAMIREAQKRAEEDKRVQPAPSDLEQTLKGVADTGFAVTPEMKKAVEDAEKLAEQKIRYPWIPPVHVIEPPIYLSPVLMVDYSAEELEKIAAVEEMEKRQRAEFEHEQEAKQPLTLTFSPGFFSRVGEEFGRSYGKAFGESLVQVLTEKGVVLRKETPEGSSGPR